MRNLIAQFPDATKRTRDRFKIWHQNYPDELKIIRQFPDATRNRTVKSKTNLEKVEEGPFKEWRSAWLLILIGCAVVVYLFISYAPQLYSWILPHASR